MQALAAWFLATGAAFPAEVPVRAFELTIPRAVAVGAPTLRVYKDDTVRLRLASDVAGEVHLHAYRLVARAAPGAPAELNFKARATGRFRIEWHPASGAATPGDHHEPLAVLEVRPR